MFIHRSQCPRSATDDSREKTGRGNGPIDSVTGGSQNSATRHDERT